AAPELAMTRNPLASTWRLLGELRADKRLWTGGHIVSWFWAVGGVALALLPGLVHDRLGGTEGALSASIAIFTVGIAVGSLVAAKASHHRPNLALVPVGAVLMAIVSGKIAVLLATLPAPASPMGPLALLTSL